MSILETKQSIATKFHNEWTETEIHWYGLEEFDYSVLDEWIHIGYIPSSKDSAVLDSSLDLETSYIGIDIMARKENRTFEIYDLINALLLGVKFGNVSVKYIDIQGKDLISTDNGDYRVLTISVLLKTI
jgi:hypothetical protein